MNKRPENTALLVMDMQAGIIERLPDSGSVVANVAKAITHARKVNIPVIYVVVGFRNGAPEISLNNRSFSASKERFASVNMTDFMQVHSALAPADGEVTVTKRRFSAFTGSDLEVLLRTCGTQHLVLTGISTSGVVLSTTREAADKDYRLSILSDCCADGDEEVHRILTTKIFPRQADVLTVDEWCQII